MPYFDNLILRRRSIIPISSSRKRGREGGALGQSCRAKSRKRRRVFAKKTVPMRTMIATDGTGGDPCGALGQGCRAKSRKRRRVFAKRIVPMRAMTATDGTGDDPCGAAAYLRWAAHGICKGAHPQRHADAFAKRRRPKLKQEGRRRAWYAWYT